MTVPICYLCGLPIHSDRGDDHLPPKQFFAPEVRRTVNLAKLITLPSHGLCNGDYSLDEEYFTATLAPVAMGSAPADAIIRHHAAKFQAGESRALLMKVLRQFTDQPGGLYLPRDLVAIKVEGVRIKRVAWKLVRGLYFLEVGALLPEHTTFMIELVEPENPDTPHSAELWERVKAQPGKGVYAGVFDYKYLHLQAGENHVHAWGILLWDRIMIFIAHHHPATNAAA